MCKLLSIVGNGLDTEAERPKLNSYYGHICLLLKEKKMSSRIKFMLQDVVALRKNNWVTCRKVEGPKTIQQLHQEVKEAEEREQLQYKNWQTTMHWRGGGRSADRGQSFHVKEVPGKVNQDSSRDCDGERKQRCHLGSSSCRGVIKIPVEHKTPPKQAGYLSEPSYLESIAKEEAQVQDCNEEQVYQALKRLLQRNCNNDKIEEWIQNTLNNRQRSSDGFVRALMRAVCQSVIVDCGVPTLRTYELLQRVSLLKKYIKEDEKQLVALNILQQLVVHIDQPDGLLRMFLDVLLDEEVIQDETFFKWKSSTVSVVSVSNFFTWLQEANRQIKWGAKKIIKKKKNLHYFINSNIICGAPNYYPNSFSAPEIQPQCVESKFKVYPDVARYKSSDEDNVTQVRTFYTEVLNDEERQRLCENFAGSLKGAQLFIQKRMVENLKAIHPDYASRVQKLLDKYNEEAEKNAHVRVYTRPGASAVAASSKM
ncbi:eukaryotic translation initiation factor 4 gamma 3-like [Takifugu rubripes]|uniref:eukaryotic translation initiation factor 4 gamma 3-like n=1 Tax=Takifugu rubripes TaxID=31033 RepID=UPI001145CA60|nr:eukaryotic translation initiation factor 4 gamma 3-like [Takifugu rubripes]